MKALYLAITDKIRAELPEVVFVDLFDGQYDNLEEEDGYVYPAIFIDFDNLEWQDGGSGVLMAENAFIRFHICSMTPERATQGRNTAKMPEPALEHLGLVDKLNNRFQGSFLNRAIDGKTFTLCTDMQKGPQNRTTRRAALKIDVVAYRTTIYDYSSSQWANIEEVNLGPVATAQLTPQE